MYYLLHAVSSLLGKLSQKNAERLGALITFFVFDVFRLRRGLILSNLKLAFGDQFDHRRRVEIGRASVLSFVFTALEFFRSKDVDIAASFTIEGKDNVQAALADGKGMYALCFHLGNWEAFASATTRQLTPAWIIVKKVGSDGVDRFVSELRDHNQMKTIRRRKKGDGMRAIVESLGNNQIIGFVMDQARPGEPRLDFFGHPAKTNTSLAAIWLRKPAPILPTYCVRKRLGEHTAYFLEELVLEKTDSPETDILRFSAQFNQAIEKIIRMHPEHYFWMHNRWK